MGILEWALNDAPSPIRALAWIASVGLLWVVVSPFANLLRPPIHSTSTALWHVADRVRQSLIRNRDALRDRRQGLEAELAATVGAIAARSPWRIPAKASRVARCPLARRDEGE